MSGPGDEFFVSRFTLKFVEIVAAGVATAISGYLIAHLGGFLSSPAPAAVEVAPMASTTQRAKPAPIVSADAKAERPAPQRDAAPAAAPPARTAATAAEAAPSRKRAKTETSVDRQQAARSGFDRRRDSRCTGARRCRSDARAGGAAPSSQGYAGAGADRARDPAAFDQWRPDQWHPEPRWREHGFDCCSDARRRCATAAAAGSGAVQSARRGRDQIAAGRQRRPVTATRAAAAGATGCGSVQSVRCRRRTIAVGRRRRVIVAAAAAAEQQLVLRAQAPALHAARRRTAAAKRRAASAGGGRRVATDGAGAARPNLASAEDALLKTMC